MGENERSLLDFARGTCFSFRAEGRYVEKTIIGSPALQ